MPILYILSLTKGGNEGVLLQSCTHTHTPWFLTSYRTALNTIFFETEFHNILELNTHLITFYKWD